MSETLPGACTAKLLELPNPFPGETGRIRLTERPGCDLAKLVARLLAGTYDKPYVIEEGDSRQLYFTRHYIQSGMRLSDPHSLEFAYTRKMMCFLFFVPQPKSILMLGLGGGSLVKYCHRHLPLTRTTVIEIDPHVLAFREQFLIPPDDARMRVLIGDGAAYLRRGTDEHDVIMLDAFDRAGLSASASTAAFYASARDALAQRGVLVANMVGTRTEYTPVLDTISDAFEDNIIVLPLANDDNCVVFAFRDASFEPRWRWIDSQAGAMRKRYGLDFPRFYVSLKQHRKDGWINRILHHLRTG